MAAVSTVPVTTAEPLDITASRSITDWISRPGRTTSMPSTGRSLTASAISPKVSVSSGVSMNTRAGSCRLSQSSMRRESSHDDSASYPPPVISALFDESSWDQVPGFEFSDITYHKAIGHGVVRIAFDRPEVRNAFRPHTVDELFAALDHARQSTKVGCVLLTGNGPSPKDGGWAFCSGGDQRIRGRDGYKYADGDANEHGGFRATGPPPHPRSAASHQVHAQDRDRRRTGMGRRGRSLTPRRVRSDPRLSGARHLQADRCRCRLLRRRVRLCLSGPANRPEASPGGLLPRARVLGG